MKNVTFKKIIEKSIIIESSEYDEVVDDIADVFKTNMDIMRDYVKKAKGDPSKSEKSIKNSIKEIEKYLKGVKSDLG